MTEKELRKLNRYELLEMLLAQGKKVERLERELAEANEKLNERQQIMASSGTMAEAALRLNHVFEAADKAAEAYLSSARHEAERIISDAKRQARMNVPVSEGNDDPQGEINDNGRNDTDLGGAER